MYQGATERYIKNGPVLSGNSTPLNFMSTHVWEEERKRKEKKKVCIRYFHVPSLFLECLTVQNVIPFQFVSPFFSPFQENISCARWSLSLFFSLSSFILDDLVANIFRHSNLDLQWANRMYQWKYIGRRHFFSAHLRNAFAQLVLISIYIPC